MASPARTVPSVASTLFLRKRRWGCRRVRRDAVRAWEPLSSPRPDLSSERGTQPVPLEAGAPGDAGGCCDRCPEPPSGMKTSLFRCSACLPRESHSARGHTPSGADGHSDVHRRSRTPLWEAGPPRGLHRIQFLPQPRASCGSGLQELPLISCL